MQEFRIIVRAQVNGIGFLLARSFCFVSHPMSEPKLAGKAILVIAIGLSPGAIVAAKGYFPGKHGGGISSENIQPADMKMIYVATVKTGLC